MKKKIDKLYRISIPSAYLKEIGIEADQLVEVEKIDNKIIISNPEGMRSEEEIKQMYRDIRNLENRGEYDKGFEDALKFILRKESE